MQRFSNAQDFQVALRQVIHKASEPNPSRRELAAELDSLAQKLGAAKRGPRKKKVAPPPPTRELVNVGKEEHAMLEYLGFALSDALADLQRDFKYTEELVEERRQDAKEDGRAVAPTEIDEIWADKNRYLAAQLVEHIKRGVEHLASKLEDHTPITQEDELEKAVQSFAKSLPKSPKGWPEKDGEQAFHDVQKALTRARAKVPVALSKPSELGALRDVLDAISDAIKIMTGKALPVPKIPNALAPDDPRQLGFGFAASGRIANANDLKTRLDVIWRAASAEHPSRTELAEALYSTARAVRPRVAVKVDEKGSGDWTVYFETENPKTIHRWKYPSKGKARQIAVDEQRKHGGYVAIMKGGIEVDTVGPS